MVGGKDNIKNVTHGVTRLRFTLKDDAKADADAIAKLDGVIKVLRAGGQFQVVIGTRVEEAYDLVVAKTGRAAWWTTPTRRPRTARAASSTPS